MSVSTFEKFKKKALANPEVKEEYIALSPAYELRKKLIRLRKQAGLSQEQLAEKLHTKKSNISRLENVNSKISPTISTVEKYAQAIGFQMEVSFSPLTQINKK